jgi:tetratricopeptide (TPR) repeat protein
VSENPRIEELRRRVQKDPASIAFAQLAEEYRRAGEHAEAAKICRAGLSRHPSYLSARVTLGRALIELGEHEDAQAELQHVLASAPENLAAIRGLAEIHQRRGNLTEALRQYQAALAIAKHDPELEESVHDLTRQLGRPHRDAPPPPSADQIAALEAGASSQASTPARAEPATIPMASLSPELEAAADEFTKALQALDALSLDLPIPPVAEPDAASALDEAQLAAAIEPATGSETTAAAPVSSDDAVVNELESWLGAIVRERAERHNRSHDDQPDLSVNSRS